MKRKFLIGIFLMFLFVGCSTEYQSTNSNITFATEAPVQVPTTNVFQMDQELMSYLYSIVNEVDYDSSVRVLHKYLPLIEIIVTDNQLKITIPEGQIESIYDWLNLSSEILFHTSSLVKSEEWNQINNIEVIYPTYTGEEFTSQIRGSDDINIASMGLVEINKVMLVHFPEGVIADPSDQVNTPLADVTSEYQECKTYSDGTVKCRIENAYCSYEPSVNGQPTYCNDAPFPNHNFTYVVWGQDVSYLDGHCLIVYGKIDYYDGKPQINWQNLDGFDGYCD